MSQHRTPIFMGEGIVILTTTPSIEGKTITDYHGLATGEAIVGANILKDLFAGIRDIVGGRSAAYEKELAKACAPSAESATVATPWRAAAEPCEELWERELA